VNEIDGKDTKMHRIVSSLIRQLYKDTLYSLQLSSSVSQW
jgi:hypothetical protein